MYKHILIPLEHSLADDSILEHIKPLAHIGNSHILLMHVADGWAARNYKQLDLAESEEIKRDRKYLEECAEKLRKEGFYVEHVLALGEPSKEIIKMANSRKIDLIAMSTHGHGLVKDILLGNTVDKVRHAVDMPVLLLKTKDYKRKRK